jgi:methionine sulfoxide reductase catalytic subunit
VIRRVSELPYSSVTPKSVYLDRRRFLASLVLGTAGSAAIASTKLNAVKSLLSTTERLTPYQVVTTYNNFYEFGTAKSDPSQNAKNFRTIPWRVSIEGAVSKPQVIDLDALLKIAPLEERIYRHRCVEAWSIVVPWIGFPLNALIQAVSPLSSAKYVPLQSLYDPKQMPQGATRASRFHTSMACEGMKPCIPWHFYPSACTERFSRTKTARLSDWLFLEVWG